MHPIKITIKKPSTTAAVEGFFIVNKIYIYSTIIIFLVAVCSSASRV
jgi:hypothetical protein